VTVKSVTQEGDKHQACGCGRIDVHAHFIPQCYAEALDRAGMRFVDGGFPVPAWSEEAALETMDRLDIETSLISLTSPSTHFLPVAERPALCRKVNMSGADLAQRRPDRFGYLAALPLNDVPASLDELSFCFDELGVDGVILETNVDGVYLGAPELESLFAELNRRGAVVLIHPTSPACFDAVALGRPAPMIEFPIDTARTLTDLIYARRLQTNPEIKVIVPHGGGAMPALAARIAAFANLPFLRPRPESEAEVFEVLARLYYDLALAAHPTTLAGLRALAPLSQMVFGSDWPFTPEFGVARNLGLLTGNSDWSAEALAAIWRENAERLFPRLKRLA
jgi:predicted TIM-barrel fold metal-dependent hydrolase